MTTSTSFRWIGRSVLTVLLLFVLLPVYVMVSSSLRPLEDVLSGFTWLPDSLTPAAYAEMWQTVPLARYLVNSLVVSLSATLLSLLVAVFAAYGVSRYRFRGRTLFVGSVLTTQMFPGILFLLPLFLVVLSAQRLLGVPLIGSPVALTLTYLTFSLPFSIWLLVSYLDTIPRELDEAASLDGAGPVRTLFHIVLPAAAPGLVAVATFTFILSWSEVLFASVLTTAQTATLAVGLRNFVGEGASVQHWNELMAASVLVSLPVVVGFLLLQRYLVAGFSAGAVK